MAAVTLFLALFWCWPWSVQKSLQAPSVAPLPGKISEPEPADAQSAHPIDESSKIIVERDREKERQALHKGIIDMLNAPITFSGRVVDQHGDPVPHANARYSLLDKFNASGSGGETRADGVGYFEISGVRGAVLGVNVSKDGYYQIHNVSNQRFAYGTGPDGYTKPPPTKEDPAILVLHKMGETEPLIYIENRSFRIPKDGTPVRVDLATGRASEVGQLKVEAWTSERDPGGLRYYDWKCRVSVPGGGLVERAGQFEFEAPVGGYLQSFEVVMEKNDPDWQRRFEKNLFLRTQDGRHARIKITFTSGGDHYLRLESHFNPQSGSRNLEYDPAKRINQK
jgi:hypothetical protein